MREYRTVLDRARGQVPEREIPFESILRRRDRRQRNRRILAGVVGFALAALVIGGWLATLSLDRSTPADRNMTPTPSPTRIATPRSLPDHPGTWSTETSLGTWTWTRVDADSRSLPFGAFFFADGAFWAVDDSELWRSEDGITWAAEPLPEALRGQDPATTQVGDDLYVEEDAGWLRMDGADWVEVEFPSQAFSPTDGMEWCCEQARPEIGGFATDGTRTLAVVPVSLSIDWGLAYEGNYGVFLIGNGDLTVFRGLRMVGNLDVEFLPGDPGAVEFRDRESGEPVLRVEATDAVPLREINGDVATDWRLVVDDGSGFRFVDPPWRARFLDSLDVASTPAGFLAVGVDRPEWFQREDAVGVHRPASFEPGDESHLFAWRSDDGISWQEVEPPPVGSDASFVQLAADDDRVVMSVEGLEGGVTLWTSSDGAAWTKVADLGEVGFGSNLSAAGPGFVLLAWGGGLEVWLSADGFSWEPAAQAVDAEGAGDGPRGCDDGGYSYGSSWVGDATFVSLSCTDVEPRILWVGRLSE